MMLFRQVLLVGALSWLLSACGVDTDIRQTPRGEETYDLVELKVAEGVVPACVVDIQSFDRPDKLSDAGVGPDDIKTSDLNVTLSTFELRGYDRSIHKAERLEMCGMDIPAGSDVYRLLGVMDEGKWKAPLVCVVASNGSISAVKFGYTT